MVILSLQRFPALKSVFSPLHVSLAVASEGALMIGTIGEIQKLHVQTVPLGETPRYSRVSC